MNKQSRSYIDIKYDGYKSTCALYCESRKSIGIHQVVWVFGSPNGVDISLKVR